MYGLCLESARQLGLSALLACTLGMPLAASAASTGMATPQSAAAPPSNADLAKTSCVIGEEKFLPADYYYCLATQTYGEQHYAYAQKFFKTAASWASKPAQYVLAVMAINGDHQPVDRPLGLAWLALAAERPDSSFKQASDAAWHAATAAERKAAEHLLENMRPVYADATAAVRAEQRYTLGMATIRRIDNEGGMYCMEGTTDLAQASNSTPDPGSCQPAQNTMAALDKVAAQVFQGWRGHVSVGPLQSLPGPAETSTGH